MRREAVVRALVLAAGRSTRIEPVTGGGPKPLLEVAGRSVLEWNLRWLLDAGLGPVWVNLHHRADQLRSAVEAMGLDGDIRFSPEDPILGTAGAWRALADRWDGTSLVVYGDNLTRFDLAAFTATHHAAAAAGALATVALFDPSGHPHTGIAGSRVLVGGDGRVAGFQEVRGAAAGDALVSTGATLLEPAVADRLAPGFADFGKDVFPALVADGALAAHVIEPAGFCLGLDTPEHYAAGVRLVETGAVALADGARDPSPSREPA